MALKSKKMIPMQILLQPAGVNNLSIKKNVKSIFKRFWLSALIVVLSAGILFGAYFYIRNYYTYRFSPYEDALFLGITQYSPCTHDLSYQEPVVPNGKYYPNGDTSALYYAEITEYKYFTLRSSDGNDETLLNFLKTYDAQCYDQNYLLNEQRLGSEKAAEITVGPNSLYLVKKNEFKVITDHAMDRPELCLSWERLVSNRAYPGSPYVGSHPISWIYYSDSGEIELADPIAPFDNPHLIYID